MRGTNPVLQYEEGMAFYEAFDVALLRRGAKDIGHCFEPGPPPITAICTGASDERETAWLAYIAGGAGSIDVMIDAAVEADAAMNFYEARIMLEAAGPKTARMWGMYGFTPMDASEAAELYADLEPDYIPMEASVAWLEIVAAKRRLLR